MLWRSAPGSQIFYITNQRHTVVKYGGRFFDVTGEVTISENDILIESDYKLQDEHFTHISRSNF